MSDTNKVSIANQPSWILETDAVRLALTERGGMMAPVWFHTGNGRCVQPYYVNPWYAESPAPAEPVLVPLRGDFFCLPFGAAHRVGKEDHAVHGEAAGGTWRRTAQRSETGRESAEWVIDYGACAGRVMKRITLLTGTPAVFTEHEVSGFTGEYPLGHHATLAAPLQGALSIAVKPFALGVTAPGEAPVAGGEYSALSPNAKFNTLERVPTRWKSPEFTSIATFPARHGFADIAGVFRKAGSSAEERLGWTCVLNSEEGWLWYSLKDDAVLPGTLFWMENHGRHADPWNGRNCCIGLEEICGYLAMGRVASIADNPVNAQGIPTAHTLQSADRLVVRTIQGVVDVPSGFDAVRSVHPTDQGIVIEAASGTRMSVTVPWRFVVGGAL